MTPRNVLAVGALIAVLIAVVVVAGMMFADTLYGQAVADCARTGAVPAPSETVAYVCVNTR